MFNEFEMLRRTLKYFLIIVMITCKTVLRKPFINREDNIKVSKFSDTVIFIFQEQ